LCRATNEGSIEAKVETRTPPEILIGCVRATDLAENQQWDKTRLVKKPRLGVGWMRLGATRSSETDQKVGGWMAAE